MNARRILIIVAAAASFAIGASSNAQTISTYAGGGVFTNAPAHNVAVPDPMNTAVASDGTVYYTAGNSVYHLDPGAGTVSVAAGNGASPGYTGDGGPATSAALAYPRGVAIDGAGNLYIADNYNNVIRRVAAGSGTITTIAGNGIPGYSGDAGPATNAQLSNPAGIALDAANNLYIADASNNVVRRVDAASGIISTVAGDGSAGYSGDGGQAVAALLSFPLGVAIDGSANLYIADASNSVIRRIDAATGKISTVAGNGTYGFSGDGGPATGAQLSFPYGVGADAAGTLYIADINNNVIRRVDAASGTISTFAGNGIAGYGGDGGPATAARLGAPVAASADAAGNVYIADLGNRVIRRVDASSGEIDTVAGNGTYGIGGDGGEATRAQLLQPFGVSLDTAENLAIADTNNSAIRRVLASSKLISTVAGNGTPGYSGDGGPATSAQLAFPQGVAIDSAGNTYIGDTSNQVIRRIDAASGTISIFAGNGTSGYSGNGGLASAAQLANPRGLAIDPSDNVYIADASNHVIRRVDAGTKIISTVAGNGTNGYGGDGSLATAAALSEAYGVAADADGNLYIADTFNNAVRRVDAATGKISTIAGNGTAGYSGDGGLAASATFRTPYAVAVDAAGELYIADSENQVIRRVDAQTAKIATVAGNGSFGLSGDGGPATSAQLAYPLSVAVNASGTSLYIADTGNSRVRLVKLTSTSSFTVAPHSLSFGNRTTGTASDPQSVTLTNTGSAALPISGITFAGTNPLQFSQTNTCASSVAVGSSCTISVVFKPSKTGPLMAKLNIATGTTAGTQAVTLTGTGVAPPFNVSPTSIAFGDQPQSTTSAPHSITVTNPGSTPVTIASITFSGKNPHQFSQTNSCGPSLAGGATCTINIVFKPTITGSLTALLNVNAGGDAGSTQVTLTGTGTQRPYTVSPTALWFGPQTPGTSSAPQTVTVTNNASSPLPITSITFTGTNPRQFSQTNSCSTSVAVGASCTITVTFKPTATTLMKATLKVTVGNGATPQNVALQGNVAL